MQVLLATQTLSPLDQAAYWDEVFQWSYTAYFVLFALGAALLLLAVFLARRFEAGWRCAGAGLFLLLMLVAVSHQASLDQRRGFIADQERRYEAAVNKLYRDAEAQGDKTRDQAKEEVLRSQYLYLPEGNSLAYLTLGNEAIAADYVWLTSLQYVSSSFRRGQKFEMLARFYKTMVELNPHWIEAEINGGKVLSALEPDRFKVEKCYIQAVLQNPDNWQLPYEAGRLFVVPPQDPRQQAEYSRHAVEWFKLARTKKGLPEQSRAELDDMIARLSLESGAAFYEEAEKILFRNATNSDSPETLKDVSRRDWLKAHSLVLVGRLQDRVDQFKQRNGHVPAGLDEIYREMPGAGAAYRLDAYDLPLEYTRETGTVWSRGVNALRAIQAAHVVAELINMYRGDHDGKAPADLATLRDYLRHLFVPPHDLPSALVTDAIGPNLDATTGPLGKWDYDAAAGTLRLPKECNSKQLYRNAYLKFGLHVP